VAWRSLCAFDGSRIDEEWLKLRRKAKAKRTGIIVEMGQMRWRPQRNKKKQVFNMTRNALLLTLHVFIFEPMLGLCSEVYVERDSSGKASALVHNGPSSELVAFVREKKNHALLATVKTVRLIQHEVDADEIACLKALESLQELVLGDHPDEVRFLPDALPQIGALPTIEHLSVYGTGKPNDFSWLDDLPKLRSLELSSDCLYSEDVFRQISRCRRLETLHVHCRFPIMDLEWLKPMTRLTAIDLRAEEVKIADCSVFAELHVLTHLAIGGHEFSSRELGDLARQCGDRLETLDIDVDSNCTIEPFVGFSNLKELAVSCPGSGVPGAKRCHANLSLYGQSEKTAEAGGKAEGQNGSRERKNKWPKAKVLPGSSWVEP
jgi:hypothetical protein